MTTLAAQTLFQHIHNKNVSAVGNLLKNGNFNLDERDKEGQTFLMVACQVGCTELVQLLLEQPEVDVNAVDNDNWTALLNAAKEGHLEVIVQLTDHREHEVDLEHRDTGGWTGLMWACYKGRLEVATNLLARGANPNVRGEHNMNCLIWASGRGYSEIVRMLLVNGAKANTSDKYGTTPLMWAARRGHLEIVELLLEEAASIDNAGMNSWTALMLAAKGGYADVVQSLLEYGPNINAVDKDSYTALTHAAKEGFIDIVNQLLEKGAYVNRPDRYGDTILIHATKGGHNDVVKALLKKHADLDVQGVDDKTALYWAVEKAHLTIVKILLEYNAGTEIQNKYGDTPLLKAVRSRNMEITQVLLEKGAKCSTTDKQGDSALHISVRGRSKRVTELLLRNPKDGRLLYRPNKNGETPYQLDSQHEKKILTQIFGARNLNADDNIEGYDLYSSTIADVLSEPSLNTPITVGLYAKWGSGKSFLIKKLIKEMKNFTQHYAETQFEFSALQFFLSFLPSLLLGVILALSIGWEIGLGVGLGILFLQYVFLAIMWTGSVKKDWRWAYYVSVSFSKRLQKLRLLLQVMFCNEPTVISRDTAAVKFLFTNNPRLASIVGEKSITAMIGTLCDALEQEYGTMVTRLYKVLKPAKASEHGRFKCLCCVPYFLIVIFVLCCIITVCGLIYAYGFKEVFDSEISTVDGIVIAFLVVIGIAFLGNIYSWSCMIAHLAIPPRKRVQKIMSHTDSLRMEGKIQNLKKEVELLGQLTRCMDAFLHNHTRLVAIVDGLDSCEQEKLLQVMDTVHMLFSDDKCPFVTILAVDPHVIIKGIEHNLHGLFRDSSINGHDYLRNLVQLPFFLHSQTKPKTRYSLSKTEKLSEGGQASGLTREQSAEKEAAGGSVVINHLGNTTVTYHKQDSTFSGASAVSIPDLQKHANKKRRSQPETKDYGSSNLARHSSQTDLSKSLGKSSYFSDINPRNMKRMMNIIAITGRLLRACNMDFNWYKLASWINITEQWPYRLSWIILEIENNEDDLKDTVPLKAVLEMIVPKLPSSKEMDPRLEIDRNEHKLDVFLRSNKPLMTVGDLRLFMHCTINVDPYLRKLIKEQIQNAETMSYDYGLNMFNPSVANFEHFGWPPTSRRMSRTELSPRATPTRPSSAMRLGTSPMPNMLTSYPGMYPHLPPNLMPGVYGPGQMNNPSPSAGQANRSSPRINLQGGLPDEALSVLSVDDICGLLYRLDNINNSRLPAYIQCFHEHNISGSVLLTCDLAELKSVLMMTFGDWELFRNLVQVLRERELNPDFADGSVQSPKINFTQDLSPFSGRIEVPKPSYPTPGANFKSKKNLSDPGFRVGDAGSMSDHYRTKSAHVMKKPGNYFGNKLQSRDYPGHYQPYDTPQEVKIQRKDSFFGEVMMESAALRSVVEAVGVITDTGEDTDDDVLEESLIFREEKSSPVRKKSVKKQDPDKSKTRKPEEDPRYKVNDSESGDSDSEVVMLAHKASVKSLKGKSANLPTLKLNNVTSVPAESSPNEGGASDKLSRQLSKSKESVKSVKKPTMKRAQTEPEEETDKAPLLKKEKDVVSRKGSSGKNSNLHLYIGSDEDYIDLPKNTSPKEQIGLILKQQTSTHCEVEKVFQESCSPAESSEHLSLRKLSQAENVAAPSAFKTVTPTSSRASSRASSLGLSLASSNRAVSREESLDGMRLSISEAGDATTGGSTSASRRSSRKISPAPCVEPGDSVIVDMTEGTALLAEHFQDGTPCYVDTSGKVTQMAADDEVCL